MEIRSNTQKEKIVCANVIIEYNSAKVLMMFYVFDGQCFHLTHWSANNETRGKY